jgi:hypothetical protein
VTCLSHPLQRLGLPTLSKRLDGFTRSQRLTWFRVNTETPEEASYMASESVVCIDIVRFIREGLFGPEDWSFLLDSAPVGLEPGVARAHYVA